MDDGRRFEKYLTYLQTFKYANYATLAC